MNILATIKNALGSKTIWGLIIAVLPTALAKFNLQITDVAAFAAGSEQLVNDVTALVGTALAVYGRARATGSLIVKKE